jgi:hypothetical protein
LQLIKEYTDMADEQDVDQENRVISDQPLSTGRDVDPPNAKPAPEHDPNVPEAEKPDDSPERRKDELEAAIQSTADQVEQEHSEKVTKKEREKLSSNTQPGEDSE